MIYGIITISALLVQVGVLVLKRFQQKKIYISLSLAVLAYILMISFQVSDWFVSDSLVIIISILAGFTIGNSISRRSSLIVFCVTAGIVDFVSFTGGLTAKIIADYSNGHNLILQNLCISIPFNGKIVPLLGFGDLFVLGIIFRSLHKIGFESWFVSLIPIAGLLFALFLGLKFHGIYALPMIGGATISFLFIEKYIVKK